MFRTLSFGSEAAEWHAEHQEPLQMSPIVSGAVPISGFQQQTTNTVPSSQNAHTAEGIQQK